MNFNVKQPTMGIRRLVHEPSRIISVISACSAVNTTPQFGPGELVSRGTRPRPASERRTQCREANVVHHDGSRRRDVE